MRALSSSIAALCIGLFFTAGCNAPGDGASLASAPPPNSLADTSAHVSRRPIPRYGPALAADITRPHLARGQVLYVPVYSHIFHRTEEREFDLTATLSIRNTSPTTLLRIHDVDYFDSEGTLLKSYLDQPRRLGPLASTYVVIDERDRSGGVGANFIVTWESESLLTPPVVEAVMISTHSGQGVSFTSPARVIQEW